MSGSATGVVRILLRLEGIFFLLTACVAYSKFGLGWRIFALWFLAPDVSFFGYLAGPKFGAHHVRFWRTRTLDLYAALAPAFLFRHRHSSARVSSGVPTLALTAR